MKYVSVWSDISNKSNELSNYNQWIPFTDDHNNPIIIGRDQNYNYQGVRAVIGGSNNHLLFITHRSNDINVFNLNTFQFIKHDTLPIDRAIFYHCFVSKSENGQGQEMMKTNKQNYQMMLFCRKAGLSIEYDEDNNTFQFHKVPVSKDIALFYAYAYVCINDVILFFGGYGSGISKSVYKYSIRENKWMTFKNALPNSLYYCAATLNEENNDIYIIGGKDDKHVSVSTHMMTKMRLWDVSQLTKQEIKYIIEYWIRTSEINFGWIDDFDKIIIKFIILVIDATFLKFNRSKKKLFYHMNLFHTDFILLCIVDNQLSFFLFLKSKCFCWNVIIHFSQVKHNFLKKSFNLKGWNGKLFNTAVANVRHKQMKRLMMMSVYKKHGFPCICFARVAICLIYTTFFTFAEAFLWPNCTSDLGHIGPFFS
ncbi:hypothetical protein RFI_34450 [Reticulomyxa filosa]|uniref:Kelch motif family protein n=1 Tax=Reticulomyxa filosa TaxID=46433 RepID=X6LNM5_RETFI|nr:hypothetical protein RFI_34450 [Reticulomyxa filosa]|eukprot:ETO02961.1 hypothetical protein RFI_34450 [Reticulomyxa filosa]